MGVPVRNKININTVYKCENKYLKTYHKHKILILKKHVYCPNVQMFIYDQTVSNYSYEVHYFLLFKIIRGSVSLL